MDLLGVVCEFHLLVLFTWEKHRKTSATSLTYLPDYVCPRCLEITRTPKGYAQNSPKYTQLNYQNAPSSAKLNYQSVHTN